MKRYIFILLSVLSLVGCIKDPEYDGGFRQRMVVDGRIEAGHCAIVMLSITTQYQGEYDKSDFADLIVRWAKVTVECDGVKEVLVGRPNSNYPTQYIYTGVDIVGEVGKTYKLLVEYSDREWRAETTITEPATLSDIRVESTDGEKLYSISATLSPTKYPCCVECSMGGGPYYAPTMLGVYEPSDEPRRIVINPPLQTIDYTPVFVRGQKVALRLSTMNDFGYDYWSMWNNNVINNANPLFPMLDNLPTNISNGGLGIWSGYGSTYYKVGVIGK
ncbi:MAG: DUF4249 family protein [Alistipes sp.]|nr:DUF4249 family protein [Alistipes sp.]